MSLGHSEIPLRTQLMLILVAVCFFVTGTYASLGDRLPEFRECVAICKRDTCSSGSARIPLGYRMLLWTCPSECDYNCRHIITDQRVADGQPVVQFFGKWPFYRFLGMQEPFSVLFSLLNFLAHQVGLSKVVSYIPASYTLRKYYIILSYVGMASWVLSMVFHTRDFRLTEQLDYFAAGANVLYGLYYTPIRIFRLDRRDPRTKFLLRIWTATCISIYVVHVMYLKMYAWDYTYNMGANVVVGVIQYTMWSWFSVQRYIQLRKVWAIWPAIAVVWIFLAMSLELFDFPPLWGMLDAHALWHLGTVFPTILWYNFLVKDAQDDISGSSQPEWFSMSHET